MFQLCVSPFQIDAGDFSVLCYVTTLKGTSYLFRWRQKKKSSFKIPFVCNDDLCLHCMCVVAETCAHIVFSDEFLFFYVLLLRGWYFHKQVKWMPTTANCIFIRTCLHNRNHQTCKQRRVEREKGGSTWSNRKQNILAHHIDNLCHVISHTWYSVQQAFEEEVLPHLPPPPFPSSSIQYLYWDLKLSWSSMDAITPPVSTIEPKLLRWS